MTLLFFLLLTSFRMIYERKLLQSSSSKKVEPNLLVVTARYVTIVSSVILDKITLSVDCRRFKVILY